MTSVFSRVHRVEIHDSDFTINSSENDTLRWDRFLLENIAEQALHDANNTGFDLPKCYPGTREAIQKDLSEWVRNVERKHPIYWLYAPAGSGKTAVAKTLADSFSNPATPLSGLLASFFFRRSHVNNEKKFVATIAYQVKTKIPITSRFIIDAIKADPAIFQKDLQVQLSKLILIPLNHASKMVKEKANWPQLIIIDGLDECAGHDAQLTVLDVVSRLALCPFPFAIFISCRPEAHIRGAFQTHIAEPSLKICLPDKYYSDDDIRTFVVGKFQAVVRSHRAFVDFPPCWPGEEVIRQLVKKSSGHFIYAAVVMNYISVSDENPVERLNIILGSLKDPDDENPFATLDALYSHILSSIKKKYRSTVETVLKIAIAQSQVSRGNNHSESDVDLGSFLLLRPGQLRYSLANLEGILLRTHATSSTVTFLHASLIDFLLDKGRSGPHYIDLRISHTEITFYFLHYIFHSGDKRLWVICSTIRDARVHVPLATTEGLYQMFCDPQISMAARKIFNLCFERTAALEPEIPGWPLLMEIVALLGTFGTLDFTLKNNFLSALKGHLRSELDIYREEHKKSIVCLLQAGALFPLEVGWGRRRIDLRPLAWSCFNLTANGTSPRHESCDLNFLNLLFVAIGALEAPALSTPWYKFLGVNRTDLEKIRCFVGELMQGIGYNFRPEVYSSKCLSALKGLRRSSTMTDFDRYWFPSLVPNTSAALERHYSCYVSHEVKAMWYILDGVVLPLLERAGPSVELLDSLHDMREIIFVLAHVDGDTFIRQERPLIRNAIDAYMRSCLES